MTQQANARRVKVETAEKISEVKHRTILLYVRGEGNWRTDNGSAPTRSARARCGIRALSLAGANWIANTTEETAVPAGALYQPAVLAFGARGIARLQTH